ncbi:hypothetical protein BIFGAL_02816 [Bifidobacterium gallicum DSM 20093 = LMG 11596]|uniref:Zinc-ribbon domain-containing protein n=2 Tax=Bifidobacterium gallicum DSM 20093 = LMG 11596 TaxID=561180 RepID=D1NSQ6_9BIFI|nr:hypothetical protein BIFGAL_02816 [Bifidobacterium gallicum DSM 20093 = LMG 11596]
MKENEMLCPNCGKTYPDTDRFCETCGVALVIDSMQPTEAMIAVAPPAPQAPQPSQAPPAPLTTPMPPLADAPTEAFATAAPAAPAAAPAPAPAPQATTDVQESQAASASATGHASFGEEQPAVPVPIVARKQPVAIPQYGTAANPGSVGSNGRMTPAASPLPPAAQLDTSRSLLAYILLSMVTFTIYAQYMFNNVSVDINTLASKYDNRKTMQYWLMQTLNILTLGILGLVWNHKMCTRVGDELRRRRIGYSFGASTYWLWGVLGSFILVGPFIYAYKLFKAMNLLSADYNVRGC